MLSVYRWLTACEHVAHAYLFLSPTLCSDNRVGSPAFCFFMDLKFENNAFSKLATWRVIKRFLFCLYLNAFEQCWKLQCLFSESLREQCSTLNTPTDVSKRRFIEVWNEVHMDWCWYQSSTLKYEVHKIYHIH